MLDFFTFFLDRRLFHKYDLYSALYYKDKTVIKAILFFLFIVFCLGVVFAIIAVSYSAEGNQAKLCIL